MKKPKSASALILEEIRRDRDREFPSNSFQAGLWFALKAIKTAKRQEVRFKKDRKHAST